MFNTVLSFFSDPGEESINTVLSLFSDPGEKVNNTVLSLFSDPGERKINTVLSLFSDPGERLFNTVLSLFSDPGERHINTVLSLGASFLLAVLMMFYTVSTSAPRGVITRFTGRLFSPSLGPVPDSFDQKVQKVRKRSELRRGEKSRKDVKRGIPARK